MKAVCTTPRPRTRSRPGESTQADARPRCLFAAVDAQHLLGLAYIDLDGFKSVNDRFSHATGDRLLCEVAACLLDTVRPIDLVARLGGDEFVVVSPGCCQTKRPARNSGRRIVRRLGRCGSSTVGVSASVGVCVTDDSGIEPEGTPASGGPADVPARRLDPGSGQSRRVRSRRWG